MISKSDLGKNLKRIRIKSKFTIKGVYSILKHLSLPISLQTIYKWEANLAKPSIQHLNALAYIYNVNICSFFNDNKQFIPLSQGEETLVNHLHKNKIFKRIALLLVKLVNEVK